jgi:hypothetical protein
MTVVKQRLPENQVPIDLEVPKGVSKAKAPLVKVIKTQLGYLRPNFWKRKISEDTKDEAKLSRLKRSYESWDLELGFTGRFVDRSGNLVKWDGDLTKIDKTWTIQLANGSHRLWQAAASYPKEKEVYVAIHNYSNVHMLQRFVDDDYYEYSEGEAARIILFAREILTKHPELCECFAVAGKTCAKIGSDSCVSVFLGRDKWPHQRVSELKPQPEPQAKDLGDLVDPPETKHGPIQTSVSAILDKGSEQPGVKKAAAIPIQEPTNVTPAETLKLMVEEDDKLLAGKRQPTPAPTSAAVKPATVNGKKPATATSAKDFLRSLVTTEGTYTAKLAGLVVTSSEERMQVRQALTKIAALFSEASNRL